MKNHYIFRVRVSVCHSHKASNDTVPVHSRIRIETAERVRKHVPDDGRQSPSESATVRSDLTEPAGTDQARGVAPGSPD